MRVRWMALSSPSPLELVLVLVLGLVWPLSPIHAGDSAGDSAVAEEGGVMDTLLSWFRNDAQQALHDLNRGDYQAAEQGFEDIYRKGVVLYRAQRYQEAADAFSQVEREAVKESARFNYGNAQYQLENFAEALRTYEEILQDNPQHQDARYNRDQTLRRLGKFLPEVEAEPQAQEEPEEEREEPAPKKQKKQDQDPSSQEQQEQQKSGDGEESEPSSAGEDSEKSESGEQSSEQSEGQSGDQAEDQSGDQGGKGSEQDSEGSSGGEGSDAEELDSKETDQDKQSGESETGEQDQAAEQSGDQSEPDTRQTSKDAAEETRQKASETSKSEEHQGEQANTDQADRPDDQQSEDQTGEAKAGGDQDKPEEGDEASSEGAGEHDPDKKKAAGIGQEESASNDQDSDRDGDRDGDRGGDRNADQEPTVGQDGSGHRESEDTFDSTAEGSSLSGDSNDEPLDEVKAQAVHLFDQLGFNEIPKGAEGEGESEGGAAGDQMSGTPEAGALSDSLAEQLLDRIEGDPAKLLSRQFSLAERRASAAGQLGGMGGIVPPGVEHRPW